MKHTREEGFTRTEEPVQVSNKGPGSTACCHGQMEAGPAPQRSRAGAMKLRSLTSCLIRKQDKSSSAEKREGRMQTYITYIHAHLDACTQLCVLVEMLAEAPVACVHIAHTSLMHERNHFHSGQSLSTCRPLS